MSNSTLNNMSDNTAQDNEPVFKEWYPPIKELIFGKKNEKNEENKKSKEQETTFLQVFFGPALYCNEIQEICKKLHRPQTEKEIADQFYNFLSVKELEEELKDAKKGGTLSSINKKIRRQLSAFIVSDPFDIYEIIESECDSNGYLKKSQQAIYYKNRDTISWNYREYQKFYIEFITVIFKALYKMQRLAEIEQIIETVSNTLAIKKDYRPNTYSNDQFKNAAYYVWIFILIRLGKDYNSDTLSRLWDESDDKIRNDLNNYASVLEYYPVNTIERFGALKILAAQGNLYAMQELYFLYLNDTVLYNTSGEMKFILKSNLSESEMLFTKLKNKGENFLPAFFRHERNYHKANFVLCLLRKHKTAYKNYKEDECKTMLQELLRVYKDKSVPFNAELFWFIKNVFDEQPSLQENKDCQSDYYMIQAQLSNNPWIAELMNSASSDSTIELHELLFFLYQKDIFKGDDILLSICHEFSNGDTELLEHYRTLAEEKLLEGYAMKIAAKRNKVDSEEIDIRSELWNMVFDILSRAIDKEKQP